MTEADVPTYQYVCTACGHQLEAVQAFSDEPLTACPACEGRLRKLFGSVGVVFKGSGFYRNDSRSESSRAEATPKTDSAPKTTESTSPAKSDKSDSSKSTTTSTPASTAA